MFILFCHSNERTTNTVDVEVAASAVTSRNFRYKVENLENLIFKYYTIMFIDLDTAFYNRL